MSSAVIMRLAVSDEEQASSRDQTKLVRVTFVPS